MSGRIKFYQDGQVSFDYSFEGVKLTKSICLAPDRDVVFIIYDFLHFDEPVQFYIRPFVGIRDFHSLLEIKQAFYFFRRWQGNFGSQNFVG